MTSKIILKKSSVADKAPLVADLEFGELALNYTDGKLYYKRNDNTIQQLNPGNMSKTTYDTNNDGIVDQAASVPWSGITGVPSTFTPSSHTHIIGDVAGLQTVLDGKASTSHTHVISDVTGLQTALDGKEAAGTASSAITTHESAVDPHPQYTTLPEIAAVTKDIHGFIDRTSTTLSFNESTRVFTVAPTSSTWQVYILGSLKTITGSLTVTIPNTTGGHFVRVNPAGTALEIVSGIPDFANDVYAAYVYWNATTSKALIVGDERHGSQRDTTWHSNQHLNVGTIWRSGGAISYTLNDANTVTLGFATPIRIADEDLLHTITHSATPTADFEQILNTAASLEVMYLDGTAYTSTTQSTNPWIAGTSTARYNQITAGSGSLVDAGEGKYVTYWVLATNDIRRPLKLVLGHQTHDSLDDAYGETFTEYGISFAEQVFMYQVVVQTSTSYSNTAKVVIAGVRKVTEKLASSASTYAAGSHSELTGRESADQHPISAITDLQTSLDGKQATLVSGTTIKTINDTSILGSGNISTQPTVSTEINAGTFGSKTALTSDINIVTTSSINPGYVVLPTPVAGKRIIVINRSTSQIYIEPTGSAQIDALGNGVFITAGPNTYSEFTASSTTQWYSTATAAPDSARSETVSSATVTPNSDTRDLIVITATQTTAIAAPTGSPLQGQKLILRIKDNGTARTLNWTTTSGGYRILGTTLPTTTTINKTIYVGCIYNATDTFWDVVAVAQEA